MSWPMVKLGDVATVNPRAPKALDSYQIVAFVAMASVSEDGYLQSEEPKVLEETKKGFTYFAKSDVLIAKITPCFENGKCLRANQISYPVGFGSTEFHVLRPDEARLDATYLFYMIWSNQFRALGAASMSGAAGQKRVGSDFLKNFEIPLPPLAEQKRIAAILDKADAIRRKRQQAIQLADDFLRAVFLEMFGDPVTNPKGWEVKKLSEISTKILNGTTPKGGSEVYVDSGVQFLRSQNVWKNHIIYDDLVYLDDKTHKSMAKSSLKHKDILMTKTGRINTENSSLGRAALFLGEDNSANINGHVYLIRLKKDIIHEFVVFILTTTEYRDYIRSVCVGGIDKRQINKEHLEDFPIILPPKLLQEKFFAQLNQIRSFVGRATDSLADAEEMFNGLSHKAFSGQL